MFLYWMLKSWCSTIMNDACLVTLLRAIKRPSNIKHSHVFICYQNRILLAFITFFFKVKASNVAKKQQVFYCWKRWRASFGIHGDRCYLLLDGGMCILLLSNRQQRGIFNFSYKLANLPQTVQNIVFRVKLHIHNEMLCSKASKSLALEQQ